MWAKHKKQSGFTIVELLIVIVVIGILAAITIVAYNGIQSRSRDADRNSDISTLQKKLEIFYATNGHYPSAYDMLDATYRVSTLDVPASVTMPPAGGQINYCWATTTTFYCYVPARAAGLTGDCVANGEKCIKYTISYLLENKSGVQYAYSAN